MEVIDWIHLFTAIIFGLAALHKLRHGQGEHFFSRFMVCLWFSITFIYHEMPIDFVRLTSNFFIVLVPIIELLSSWLLKYWKKQ